jgi:hypothetical protein
MQVVDYGFPVLSAKPLRCLPPNPRVPIEGRIQFGPTISLRSGGSNLPHLVVPSVHLPCTAPVFCYNFRQSDRVVRVSKGVFGASRTSKLRRVMCQSKGFRRLCVANKHAPSPCRFLRRPGDSPIPTEASSCRSAFSAFPLANRITNEELRVGAISLRFFAASIRTCRLP